MPVCPAEAPTETAHVISWDFVKALPSCVCFAVASIALSCVESFWC